MGFPLSKSILDYTSGVGLAFSLYFCEVMNFNLLRQFNQPTNHQSGKFVLCNRDLGCAVLMFPIYLIVKFQNLGLAIRKLSSQDQPFICLSSI